MVHVPLRISALHFITGYVLRIALKTYNIDFNFTLRFGKVY